MATAKQRPSPRSALRLLQLLQILADNPNGQSLAALAKKMTPPTPKSSVLNLLRSLTANRFVEQNENGYRLSQQSFQLASAILAHREFPEIAKPTIRKLVDTTGETAMIAVLSEKRDSIVYIDKVESRSSLRFSATIGDQRPLYCTAGGIAFLAFAKAEWVRDYLRDIKFRPLTERTTQSRKKLQEAIAATHSSGVAVTYDQATDGVTGIAVPIFDSSQDMIATLILAAPSVRISERIDELSQALRATGMEISRMMGAKPIA